MTTPKVLIKLLENDLEFVRPQQGSFDGMIVAQNLNQLLSCNPTDAITEKVQEMLQMYNHDGRQCFSEEDRPKLAQLLEDVLEHIKA